MSVLSDITLKEIKGMIEPFESELIREVNTVDGKKRVISYGLSSYGYDARLAPEFRICNKAINSIIDPKEINPESFTQEEKDFCIIPPHGFVLGHTIEYFKIPRDVLVICLGKSTYARCGLVVNVTPLEAGWEGQVTLELSNTTDLPIKVYANEGICQFVFLRGDKPCSTSYDQRNGKYQGQKGVTLSKL